MAISKRLPPLAQIASVYAVIVLVVYSWTILRFFWKLPSWLYFLSIGEILTIFAYSLVVNLIESVLVLSIPVGLSLFLPRKWSADTFVTRSVVVSLSSMGYAAYILTQFQSRDDYPNSLVRLIPLVFLAFLALAFMAGKIKFLSKVIDFFAEQATIFLYITIPLSLISLMIILVRVLF